MNTTTTRAVVLKRRDFQEADRILTVLTEQLGKVGVIAKGVRRMKSKLAGGIELMSISELTLIRGRGQLLTLRSAKTETSFEYIVAHYERMQRAYTMLEIIYKITEDEEGEELFDLLATSLSALNTPDINPIITDSWFSLRLLALSGHEPNLQHDVEGTDLASDMQYVLQSSAGGLTPSDLGPFGVNQIKLMRLALQVGPADIARVKQAVDILQPVADDINEFMEYYIR